MPLPPCGVNVIDPLGATEPEEGDRLTPAVTVMFAAAVFPSESVTCATAVTLPVAPAVYTPLLVIDPPEGCEVSVH